MLLPIAYYPYARPGPGLGRAFGSKASRLAWPLAMLLTGAAAFLGTGPGLLAGGLLITALIGIVVARVISTSLGGHTGDTYGALCEFTEMVFLLVVGIGLHI
jgi:Cobalamin-5-phosphate synthase